MKDEKTGRTWHFSDEMRFMRKLPLETLKKYRDTFNLRVKWGKLIKTDVERGCALIIAENEMGK